VGSCEHDNEPSGCLVPQKAKNLLAISFSRTLLHGVGYAVLTQNTSVYNTVMREHGQVAFSTIYL
jgi:hypothetical protein